jgi:Rieske Fe-S protein
MTHDAGDDTDRSRRAFLGQCAFALEAAAIGAIALPFSSCGASRVATQEIGDNRIRTTIALLVADGMSQILDREGPDGHGIVVVRESAESFAAFSMKCTHKGCEIEPPDDDGIMVCPCHGSRFDRSGAVVSPPAKTPLKRYATTLDVDSRAIVITLA